MNIDISPGSRIRRTELHKQYGGRRQGGISPSAQSPNVFLITAASGEAYGYLYDGWADDGLFHYTGEGQVGDQRLTQGNRTIHDHEAEGGSCTCSRRTGRSSPTSASFATATYQADAPEVASGPTRKVLVFRLEQISGEQRGPKRSRIDQLGHEPVKEVPIEQQITERSLIEGDREPYESERREQKLVRVFTEHLERNGSEVCRLQFRPEGEAAPIYCDVFDKTTRTLYEAKGTVTRQAIRMAIGQLADYGRLVEPAPAERAVLLPERPRPDLVALALSQGLSVVWPTGGAFEREAA